MFGLLQKQVTACMVTGVMYMLSGKLASDNFLHIRSGADFPSEFAKDFPPAGKVNWRVLVCKASVSLQIYERSQIKKKKNESLGNWLQAFCSIEQL